MIRNGEDVDAVIMEVERMSGVRVMTTLKRMSFERGTGRTVIALSVGQTLESREKYKRFFLELNSVVSVK